MDQRLEADLLSRKQREMEIWDERMRLLEEANQHARISGDGGHFCVEKKKELELNGFYPSATFRP